MKTTTIQILYLQNAVGSDELQEYHCKDAVGTILLILTEEDVKHMYAADLEPANDDDLFTYANHLLGGRFTSYLINHDVMERDDEKKHLQKDGISLLTVSFDRRAGKAMVIIDFLQDIAKAVRSFTQRHPEYSLDYTRGTSVYFRKHA